MSLIKREPSPAQVAANRANGKRSAGPLTVRGKAISRRNLPAAGRPFSEIVKRSMEALGEHPQDLEHRHRVLAEAMEPRDGWEAAWIQDIAILRWRLEHLQRSEISAMAVQRRRLDAQRRRAASPPTGSASIELKNMVAILGFTGIPDSTMKFKETIEYLKTIQEIIELQMFAEDIAPYFTLLYGQTPGPQSVMLKARYDVLAKHYKEGRLEAIDEGRRSLLADVSEEIEHYQQLHAIYNTEFLDVDPIQQDAGLLLAEDTREGIIRYENHLEDQIERKLRQFYARRREAVYCPTNPDAGEKLNSAELVRSQGIA